MEWKDGGNELAFGGIALGFTDGSGLLSGRSRRWRISSSRPSGGGVFQRTLMPEFYSAVTDVCFSLVIVSCDSSFYRNRGKGWRIKIPGKII